MLAQGLIADIQPTVLVRACVQLILATLKSSLRCSNAFMDGSVELRFLVVRLVLNVVQQADEQYLVAMSLTYRLCSNMAISITKVPL